MRKNNPDPRRIPKTDKKKPLKLLKTKVRDKNQESGQSSQHPLEEWLGLPNAQGRSQGHQLFILRVLEATGHPTAHTQRVYFRNKGKIKTFSR